MRRFIVLIVLLLVVGGLFGRSCVLRPATSYEGDHFNKGTNAAWLDVVWVMNEHSQEEIAALANDLDRRQVRTLYTFVSYLKPEGQFNPTYDYAYEFVQTMKRIRPNLEIQAWIGLPVSQNGQPSDVGHVDLSDPTVRQKIVQFCAKVVRENGFDGVHIDAEPVRSDDETLLALLDELREVVGPDLKLSVATRRIGPFFPEQTAALTDGITWSPSYYQEVARRTNQLAVMTYDSYLPWPWLYRLWVRFQVIEISRAVEGTGTNLLIGIPTSEEKTGSHQPDAENMKSGIEGVVDGLNDADARPAVVSGIAIYPQWETDEAEWTTYESLWLGQH